MVREQFRKELEATNISLLTELNISDFGPRISDFRCGVSPNHLAKKIASFRKSVMKGVNAMKKLILKIVIGLVVLVVIAVVVVILSLNTTIKRGVETVGPKLTKTSVNLDNVSLSLLSGSGQIHGLVVGNPEGFKSPHAISVGSATLALKPGSLLSDKVVINKIEVVAPEITFEGGLSGNNLSKLLDNVNQATGGGGGGTNAPAPSEEKAAKKLQVDDFAISGAKVHVNLTDLNKSGVVSIPDIHLKDLGTGPEGITAGELTKRVLHEVERAAAKAAAGDLGKLGLTNVSGALGTNAADTAGKVGEGLNKLLKK
jgi:hypothetical protein